MISSLQNTTSTDLDILINIKTEILILDEAWFAGLAEKFIMKFKTNDDINDVVKIINIIVITIHSRWRIDQKLIKI